MAYTVPYIRINKDINILLFQKRIPRKMEMNQYEIHPLIYCVQGIPVYETDVKHELVAHVVIEQDNDTRNKKRKFDDVNEELLKCTIPGCMFKTAGTYRMQSHIKYHQDEFLNRRKIFHCNFAGCGYISACSSNFRVHKRVHSGLRPYVCSQCSFTSAQSNNLKTHRIRNHPETLLLDFQQKALIINEETETICI